MSRYYRKVIRITAEQSPNVRYGLAQKAKGIVPTDEIILPGVLSYGEYVKRLKMWGEIEVCVSLHAQFYEGAESRLYPKEWLDRAHSVALRLEGKRRKAKCIGCDPAEGGDDTCWSVVDEYGLIEMVSLKTFDTGLIADKTIELIERYGIEQHENVLFDRGGGGKQHVDYLRRKGYKVRSVGFGEAASDPEAHKRFHTSRLPDDDREDKSERKYSYKNRRSEMYGILRWELLDPAFNHRGFGLPEKYAELRRQLQPLPLTYDNEGRLALIPKDKPTPSYTGVTIKSLLGCSPDEADSLVLAVFGLLRAPTIREVGAIL